MRPYVVIPVCIYLASCAGAKSIDRIAFSPVSKESIILVDDLPLNATLTGGVRGLSCAPSPWAPDPSRAEALDKMKQQAADMGATGIYHVRYGTLGITISEGCWSGVVASGVAYHISGG